MIEPIPNFPGYFVSDDGRVFSAWRQTGFHIWTQGKMLKELKKAKDEKGYEIVALMKDGKLTTKKVHQLVAFAFLKIQKGKFEINHKDGIKTNNRAENLEYSTHLENMRHAYRTGIRKNASGENAANAKLNEVQVKKIKEMLKCGIFGKQIAKIFNVHPTTISLIRNGFTWANITA